LAVFFGVDSEPYYQLEYQGRPVLKKSRLGFDFLSSASSPKSPTGMDGPEAPWLSNLALKKTERRTLRTSYDLPIGKTKTVTDDENDCVFQLTERSSPFRKVEIQFRVFKDGVGFRYFFPDQPGMKDFVIGQERTSFVLPERSRLYAMPLPFNSSFEAYYQAGGLQEFTPDQTLALPLLVETSNHRWLALTEAALTDFAGLYVVHSRATTLESRLAPSQENPAIKVKGVTPFSTPWRVLMVGSSPGPILESNILYNLNEPSKIADVSWIHPGKVQFPWWSSYRLSDSKIQDPDPSHRPGTNTWTFKRFIDFCAANGIESHSIDGLEQAWYGGPTSPPAPGVDLTKSIPEIDIPEILRYGKAKGVRTRLWMHVQPLLGADMDALFATYQSWGIEGVMIDFLNRDDQQMVRFYSEAIRKAAEHHLTINFHGVWKPTGVERTYPNLLSQENIYGTEYDKWSKIGCSPNHQVMAAFVRGLAGPADIHPGSFHPVLPPNYHPEPVATRAQGTLARQLALYVVFYSHVPMLVDTPEAYTTRSVPFEFVKQLPSTWDEVRVLSSKIPHAIAIARRHGKTWFVGSITDQAASSVEISLNFLGPGRFVAEVYSDGADARKDAESLDFKKITVNAKSRLTLNLAPAGGNAIRILPAQ
jgi:alpha-glucosidase